MDPETGTQRTMTASNLAERFTVPPPVALVRGLGPSQPRAEGARRVLNVAVAVVGLVIAAPVMAVIALLIRLTSPGPVLFMQTRVGLDRRNPKVDANGRRHLDLGGQPFRIYKFRTMYVQPKTEQVWARPDDPRITPVGRVLRKYRLDELPQLLNVLRGDMNIVGPRPEQPGIVTDLQQQITSYQLRHKVRPGITGWAQINHHYDRSIEDVRRKVSLDLEYIGRQSFTEDLKIMLRTVPVVVLRKGGW
jgi:lipopolysaccharide/colanic/teichoic acid biosynthesis glycosyltransferase